MTYFYKTYSFNIFQNKTFQEIAESEGIRNVWIRSGVVLGRKGFFSVNLGAYIVPILGYRVQ